MNSIDLQPVLKGNTIYLRPLDLGDFEALYQVASDPKIWELHPDSERYKREIFRARFFESALASGGALAIEENDTGRIIGSSRYYEWKPDTKEVSIGYTFIERQHWGTGTNRELKDLMLRHIYKWAAAVWFHVAKTNIRSRRSVENLGAILSHEKERELNGNPFTQLYYKLEAPEYRV
ncbi:GNAT family N-acetyltransferase [Microbulbifer litoralis]|uniref:GNAT family N-acetyltransferase n=1 Tax=Microbulbifer litoralis TaxID=2933965 RepID=UPI0020290A91|nr:GNAT family N-acetyltransferase [Microbulbifer sp. GX H0434]